MTAIQIKEQLHKAIDIIDSEQLLKAVYIILNEELKHKKETAKPFTTEEFYARHDQSQKDIKQAKLIEHKSLKKKYTAK